MSRSCAASCAFWLVITGGCAGKIVDGPERPTSGAPSDAPGGAPNDAPGGAPNDAPRGAPNDAFGVRMLYPSVPGGRSWLLPERAELPSSEWNVERMPVRRVAAGVFHTQGNAGEVRLSVGSPATLAWWRNMEVTGYFRYTASADSNQQLRHWELVVRGERHARGDLPGRSINGGVPAPAGTDTWPGYPFGSSAIGAQCLGSSYHGNFYADGRGLFEKELSHSDGYARQRAVAVVEPPFEPSRWFGLKLVAQNGDHDRRVHLELWIDAQADNTWLLLTQTDDTPLSWPSTSPDLQGCGSPPFSFSHDQLLTWAGPWVTFRSDSLAMDFRWLSIREISALP